jgi:site-specific DNA-methyltransferase (adenine-specific)
MLTSLRDESADIIFLDPPFNLGKAYGRRGREADRLLEDDYFRYLRQVLDRSVSVLKNGGALYIYHLPKWALRLADVLHQQLTFRHWIAIPMKSGFARGKRLYPAHYALLYYTKGEPATFRRPKISPPRCRHCNRYTKDYGGYARYVANGVNLSDIWDDLSPVRHRKYKHHNSNELPIQIPIRVISISGRPNALFVDPFAGTGTSLVAASEAGMRFVACDRERQNWLLIKKRLSKTHCGPVKGSVHENQR